MKTRIVSTVDKTKESVFDQIFGEVVVQAPGQLSLDSHDEIVYIARVDQVNAERIKGIFRQLDWARFPLLKVVADECGMILTDEILEALGRCQIAAKKMTSTEEVAQLIIGLLHDPSVGIKAFDNEDSWILAYGSGYPS